MADEGESAGSEPPAEKYVPKKIWIYGINDHLTTDVPAGAADMALSGDFTKDFTALCEKVGVTGHSVMTRPLLADSTALIVSSQFVDRVSIEVFAQLIDKSKLDTVRFSSCGLDMEMTTWVSAAVKNCNVHTFHLDWNPVELPLILEGFEPTDEGPGMSSARLDQLELDRRYKQEARQLRLLDREIRKRCATVEAAMAAVQAESAGEEQPGAPDDGREQWIVLERFARGLLDLGIPTPEVDDAVNIFDGALHGRGDGGVMLDKVESILHPTRPLTQEDIDKLVEELGEEFMGPQQPEDALQDEIGLVFAAFLTSCLENVSFRACQLSISEVPCIAKALGESLHIQQLNLWSNRIDDDCVELIAAALADNHTLQYLGLGRNRVGDAGLLALGAVCGQLEDVELEGDGASMAAAAADRQKNQQAAQAAWAKTGPPKPEDPTGRPRYVGDQMHVDQLLEVQLPPPPSEAPATEGEAPEPPGPIAAKLWYRNTQLRTLDLSHNQVSDEAAARKVTSWGFRAPTMILRGNPVAAALKASPVPEPAPRPELQDQVIGWIVVV